MINNKSFTESVHMFPKLNVLTFVSVFVSTLSLLTINQVLGFHLSFGHRLFKSAPAPQFNPASSLIRPIECRNANNQSEVGICMFSIDCMQNKGVPLSVCKHNYFVGTCCKLPDYNNFVGIVYDLRDTESNLLESRKANAASPIIPMLKGNNNNNNRSSQLSLEQPSNSAQTTLAPSSSTTNLAQRIQAQDFSQNNLLVVPASSDQQVDINSQRKRPQPADESTRYIISSTSLFPSAGVVEQIRSSNKQSAAEGSIVISRLEPQPTSTTGGNGESARNVDGSLPAEQQIFVPSELDSFQIQTTLASPISEQPAQVSEMRMNTASTVPSGDQLVVGYAKPSSATYELIKDDNNSLEVLSTINSAHSSVASSPATMLNMIDSNSRGDHLTGTNTASTSKLPTSSKQEIGLSSELKQQPSYQLVEEQPGKLQQNIVFANNHQHSSSLRPEIGSSTSSLASFTPPAGSSTSKQTSLSPSSDQEFTLSSASLTSTQSQAPQTTKSDEQQVTSSMVAKTSPSSLFVSSADQSSPSSTTQVQDTSSSSWPGSQSSSIQTFPQFTDLLSSPSSSQQSSSLSGFKIQTTTPFTTSLSTALLPNVSMHPTEVPNPAQLVELQSSSPLGQQEKQQQQQSYLQTQTQPQQSFLTSEPTPSKPATALPSSTSGSYAHFSMTGSSAPAETTPSQASSLGQLYSSTAHEHQQQAVSTRGPSPMGGYPSLVHQAATSKIVSSTSGSSVNNFIPGLSGLQSAILSHIPFKLASGLSSGLSSYLQAAMKPNGASRPLISSNTAPALQFQQTVAASSPATSSLGSTTSTPRPTLGHTFPTSQTASAGSVKFPSTSSNLNDLDRSPQAGNSTVASSVSSISVSPAPLDSQLVCGRPQVTQMLSSPALADASSIAGLLRRRVGRIVGGNQSMFGQWPWMVSLRQWRKGAFLHKCGAALLNEKWAITAAHCVENVKASDLLLRLGEFDVSSQEEPYPYVERRVKQVVSHPSFDSKTFEYDLALLRFAEPVRYERNIVPVCVPAGNDSYVDRMATVIGWGRLYEDGPLPDVIQHVDVPIITNNECEKMYKNAGYIEEIPNMFICAGISKGGRDSCEGDSGGPLTMVDHDGRSYLVGIISWGIGCALPSQPGVYTRITAFSGWINQIISN